jgi:hypothetical protein
MVYNKLSWFVFELPEKDISNVVASVGSILQQDAWSGVHTDLLENEDIRAMV